VFIHWTRKLRTIYLEGILGGQGNKPMGLIQSQAQADRKKRVDCGLYVFPSLGLISISEHLASGGFGSAIPELPLSLCSFLLGTSETNKCDIPSNNNVIALYT